jgi:hypothetical protein
MKHGNIRLIQYNIFMPIDYGWITLQNVKVNAKNRIKWKVNWHGKTNVFATFLLFWEIINAKII